MKAREQESPGSTLGSLIVFLYAPPIASRKERIAQMQDSVANLIESVRRGRGAFQRLRRIAFGFMALFEIVAALGWNILPKALKAGVLTLM